MQLEGRRGLIPLADGQEVDETECLQGQQGIPQLRAGQTREQFSARHRAGTEQQLVGNRRVREAGKQPQQRARVPHPLGGQHVKGDLPGLANQPPGVLLGKLPASGTSRLISPAVSPGLAAVQESLVSGKRPRRCMIAEGSWPARRLMKVGPGKSEGKRQPAETTREGNGILAAPGLRARVIDKDLGGIIVGQHPDPA